jgi:carbamoylphosphate synthase small subunit
LFKQKKAINYDTALIRNVGINLNAVDSNSASLPNKQELSEGKEGIDVIIFSNGPGEVSSWVQPVLVVQNLRKGVTFDSRILRILRISVQFH